MFLKIFKLIFYFFFLNNFSNKDLSKVICQLPLVGSFSKLRYVVSTFGTILWSGIQLQPLWICILVLKP